MAPQEPAGWRTSSRSQGAENCVEVGSVGSSAAVRDTKDRAAGYITTSGTQWQAFIRAVKTSLYDS